MALGTQCYVTCMSLGVYSTSPKGGGSKACFPDPPPLIGPQRAGPTKGTAGRLECPKSVIRRIIWAHPVRRPVSSTTSGPMSVGKRKVWHGVPGLPPPPSGVAMDRRSYALSHGPMGCAGGGGGGLAWTQPEFWGGGLSGRTCGQGVWKWEGGGSSFRCGHLTTALATGSRGGTGGGGGGTRPRKGGGGVLWVFGGNLKNAPLRPSLEPSPSLAYPHPLHTPFPSLGRLCHPDCPCPNAPGRVHTEEGNCARRWPRAFNWAPNTGGGEPHGGGSMVGSD